MNLFHLAWVTHHTATHLRYHHPCLTEYHYMNSIPNKDYKYSDHRRIPRNKYNHLGYLLSVTHRAMYPVLP